MPPCELGNVKAVKFPLIDLFSHLYYALILRKWQGETKGWKAGYGFGRPMRKMDLNEEMVHVKISLMKLLWEESTVLKWTKPQKKIICFFALALVAAMISTSFPISRVLHFYDIHSFIYMGIIIAWGFLVHQRILNAGVRFHLDLATVFMLLLFVSRMFRYCYFHKNPVVTEYAWYAYYISFTIVPLSAFFASLYVGRMKGEDVTQRFKWLWGMETLLILLIFTNPLHGQLFQCIDEESMSINDYGLIYYMVTIWGVLLTLVAFFIILKRCKIKEAKKHWMIPGLCMLLGLVGMLAYYVCGGSPTIYGIKLYNLQEVFCFTFILPFEYMIQQGILPNNSRYELFFQKSPIRAVIMDKAGRVAYESGDYKLMQFGQTDAFAETEGAGQGNYRRNEKEIQSGKVVWYEDMTAIQRIGEEIRKVTEQLEEENDLILQENEIRAERIGYETKNRLYDKIAKAVKEKAIAINELLNSEELRRQIVNGDEKWKERLVYATVQGVYVKRMGNLMLIAEENKTISTRELGISIKESLEYFALSGKAQELREKGDMMLPSGLILHAFEIYEDVMELAYEQIYSMAVKINCEKECFLSIEFDAGEDFEERFHIECMEEKLLAQGIKVSVTYLDDTWKVSLQFAQ